jgi:effector-binding domain-containing protein
MFLGKRTEIVARLRAEQELLGRVDAYLAQLANQDKARYDVVVRHVEPLLVASVRSWVAAGDSEHESEDDVIAGIFEELEQYAARFKSRALLPPAIVYHDNEYRTDGHDLEVIVPLSVTIPATERIQVYELPGWETVACLIHSGGYEHLSQTLAALLQWIELNGYTIAGPMRESFLRFGADQKGYALPESYVTTLAEELVTELQVPVVKV